MEPITREQLVAQYGGFIKRAVEGTGIHPEILIGQMILESSGKDAQGNRMVGASGLAQEGNNWFGIKADRSWKGPTVTKQTRLHAGEFRKYNALEESIVDYVKFLQENPRYKKAGVFDAKTYEEQALAIGSAGYSASSSNYGEKLAAVAKPFKSRLQDIPVMEPGQYRTRIHNASVMPESQIPEVVEVNDGPEGTLYKEATIKMPDSTTLSYKHGPDDNFRVIGGNLYLEKKSGDRTTFDRVPTEKNPNAKNNYWTLDEYGYPKSTGVGNMRNVYDHEIKEIGERAENGFLAPADEEAFNMLLKRSANDLNEAERKDFMTSSIKQYYVPHSIERLNRIEQFSQQKLDGLKRELDNASDAEYDRINTQYQEALQQHNRVSEEVGVYKDKFDKFTSAVETEYDSSIREMYDNPDQAPTGTQWFFNVARWADKNHLIDPAEKSIIGLDAEGKQSGLMALYEEFTAPPEQTDPDLTQQPGAGGGSGTGAGGPGYGFRLSQPRTGPAGDVLDMGGEPGAGIVAAGDPDSPDYAAEIEKERQLQADLQKRNTPVQAQGDEKLNLDFIDHAADAGRALVGFKGASEEVPTYTPSEPFQEYIGDARRMKDMGMSADEEAHARGLAERAYFADIENVKRLSGGSAGVALANLGRASGQLYNRFGQISAEDRAIRRSNFDRFGRAAGAAEGVNRQIFEDRLRNVIMNKQAGAALARDAITNMLNRRQFQKHYGPDSPYGRYVESKQAQIEDDRELSRMQKSGFIDTQIEQSKRREQELLQKQQALPTPSSAADTPGAGLLTMPPEAQMTE
ncbi:MAG: glucosaminidase domain-containing protein [Candidatus Thorarchaeota archaeon]